MRRARTTLAAIALAGLVAPTLLGCGGGTSLPDVPACTVPTATPTPRFPTQGSGGYFTLARNAINRLDQLLTGFRAAYPDGLFYRSSAFREDFAVYSGAALCVIVALDQVQLPSTASDQARVVQGRVREIMAEYAAIMQDGREAVRQRNTSGYRDWNRKIDDISRRLSEVVPSRQ